MSDIRVTYSGLIALTVGITSVITGSIFTLLVTRRLSPEEFGIWSIIGSMISYFLVSEPVISFWTTRQIARGEQIGKTSLLSSTIFSIGAIPLFLVLSYYVSAISHSHYDTMIIASALLPVSFISQTLSGINLGHKPHVTSYGLMIFESLKIPVGISLVYFLGLGLNGAIITTIIAYVGKIGIQIYFGRVVLKNKFSFTILKHWIKLSWLPLYSNVPHLIWSLDVIVYTIITKSVIGVAYFMASSTISAVIGNAGLISQAIYPKLLAKGTYDHITDNFSRLMFFAIPLLGLCLIFSKPALFALNPAYQNASIVVMLYSFRTFFYVVTSTLNQILIGLEQVDIEENHNYKLLAKSKLFLIPTLLNIHYSLYVIILTISLVIMNMYRYTELDLVIWWSCIAMILQIPFFFYALFLVKKSTRFSFPYNDVLKYAIGTILMIMTYVITSNSILHYEKSIFDFLPNLIAEFFICGSVYLLTMYIIDTKTRKLFKSIIKEIHK